MIGFNGSTVVYPVNQSYTQNLQPLNNGYQLSTIPVTPVANTYSNPQVPISYQAGQPYDNYYNPIKY